MPSLLNNYIPQITRFHICKKGNNHAQQPLNLVCLDPICRNHPLICPTCFSEYHKYHKTVPLDIFISDYQASIKKNHKQQTVRRIKKQYKQVKSTYESFRSNLIQKINQYGQNIEQYFKFLLNSLNVREQLSNTLNITLEPKKIVQAKSKQEQQQSLIFIIQNSLFNEENRLVNISSILKYDQPRTNALIDKISNQSMKLQTQISTMLQKLNFTKQTIGKQSIRINNFIKQFNQKHQSGDNALINKLQMNPKAFVQKQTMITTLNKLDYTDRRNQQNFVATKLSQLFMNSSSPNQPNQNDAPLFVFSNVYKHDKLSLENNNTNLKIKSNVTALKPQYAIICPSVDFNPQKQQNWSIKIKSCRNFASSKNTIAVGICSLKQIQDQNYEENIGKNLNQQYMLTSQGFLIKNGREERCDFTFIGGDILNLKYDPYYKLLIISKDNGRKVTIKINKESNEQKLFGCVRLTYASDQVQILNHTNKKNH